MEEPTDKLSGGHCSRSGDYGCPAAGTFDQEQGEDLLWSLFLHSESQSPPSSLLWLSSMPPAEGVAGIENLGDGQISPLDEVPCCTAAAVNEETNYAAAPAPPVATHGTRAGQFSSNISLSSTTSHEFDEEEVQQAMVPWQLLLHLPMAADVLSNSTNGGPTVRSHAEAVSVVQQDELSHPQQQLDPLPSNTAEVQLDPLLVVDEEVQMIQQMMPTISPSQPLSPTPVINPGPDEAHHAASAPMGLQGTLVPATPGDQEANILSRPLTRRRPIKSRDLRSGLQDGSSKLFVLGIDMIRQFGRYIGQMMKEEEKDRSIVWQHFWSSRCKHCCTLNVMCQYCNTVMRDMSTCELSRHLECYHNNIYLLLVASRASKTQRSSQALQIKEIAQNTNGETELIERGNRNCATVARVDTPSTNNTVVVHVRSPPQQHQLMMDREEQTATILSSRACCQGRRNQQDSVGITHVRDLIMRLSESSSTTKSTHDGFRLKLSNNSSKTVHLHLSPAWVHVRKNPFEDQNHAIVVDLRTLPSTIRSSYLSLSSVEVNKYKCESASAWCTGPWQYIHLALCGFGFKKEFAANLVMYAFRQVEECMMRLRSPSSSNNGRSIAEQGDASSSGKRKRKPLPPRSKVWNHFTKEVVEGEGGSMVKMARCNHCGSKLKADPKKHGTRHLGGHIKSRHPEHAESL